MHKLSLIVPVYNEQETIMEFYDKVIHFEALKSINLEIVFINDGSKDDTLRIINNIALADNRVVLIDLSRNFGKENALCAGIEYATGDIVIPIDVDLQDPIEVIPLMIEKWENGAQVVLGKRVNRESDTYFKRKSAEIFYTLHNYISSPKIEENVGDFRLMDRQVVDELKKLSEKNVFMKGLFSWVGFKTEIVTYTRESRFAGSSKFNFWKLWNLALEGITSFSTVPLRLWTYIGLSISSMSILYGLFMIFKKIFFGIGIPGYPSLLVSILFLGGIQLIGIGVIGEYVGRIYTEIKGRPRYIVNKVINSKRK